ncbi:hypothetical protein RN001_008050 [Aquatica leii]|uniref:Peptidoglycan-recognition protein n=1 Tax=Aquatica leii TaxID=1421715 RepID=A0AAN7PX39_9COLE|nr:hypothetical protein RN001_008050 [Aquatica leii]
MFLLIVLILATVFTKISGDCPNIINRSAWGSSETSLRNLRVNPATHVIIHHSTGPTCLNENLCKKRVKSIQNYHIEHNRWDDIGYNFLVGEDGNVYEGRGWDKSGAHAPNYNDRSIGICVIGDYSSSPPNAAALNALKLLISCGETSGKITSDYKLVGHRQVRSTECPGQALYREISTWYNWASRP